MTTALHTIADAERRRRAQEIHGFAVARETFTYVDSSVGPVTIGRGEYVYDLGHEAVVTHPEKFDMPGQGGSRGPSRPELNETATAAAAVSATPSWSLWPSPPVATEPARAADVELRDRAGTLKVSFRSSAAQAIREEALVFRTSGLETGGQLFAHESELWSWSPSVCITLASGPGTGAKHAPHWLKCDGAHDAQNARDIEAWSQGALREAGHWHVHPSGRDVPSQADLAYWVSLLELNRLSRFVGVIVNHEPRRMSPWVVHPSKRSIGARYICERGGIA